MKNVVTNDYITMNEKILIIPNASENCNVGVTLKRDGRTSSHPIDKALHVNRYRRICKVKGLVIDFFMIGIPFMFRLVQLLLRKYP